MFVIYYQQTTPSAFLRVLDYRGSFRRAGSRGERKFQTRAGAERALAKLPEWQTQHAKVWVASV